MAQLRRTNPYGILKSPLTRAFFTPNDYARVNAFMAANPTLDYNIEAANVDSEDDIIGGKNRKIRNKTRKTYKKRKNKKSKMLNKKRRLKTRKMK